MKFKAGMTIECDNVEFEILKGDNCDGDMRIRIRIWGPKGPSEWHTPRMSLMMILAAFKYAVEENNYGPENGKIQRGDGGEYLLERLNYAMRTGDWETVIAETRRDAEAAKARRAFNQQLWENC